MNIRYRVDLTAEERDELGRLLSGGRCAARRLKRAQILLAADDGVGDQEIERTIGASSSTIHRSKRRLVERGLAAALSEEPRPGAGRNLPASRETSWLQRPAQSRRRDGPAGRSSCCPAK
jgi:hypothetical protein